MSPKALSSPTAPATALEPAPPPPTLQAMTMAIKHQRCLVIVLLSIVLLAPGQATGFILPRAAAGALPTQLLLNELLSARNEDNTYYGEQMKYQQRLEPNYFATNWPSLRDLLLTTDYDDSNGLESNEQLSSRFMTRLRKLSDNAAAATNVAEELRYLDGDELTNMPAKKMHAAKMSSSLKEHNTKKNVQFRKQYMSPCHFKICNMGRKRNAGSYVTK